MGGAGRDFARLISNSERDIFSMRKNLSMKRGLATVAVSALAVTGLPFLTNAASATPLSDQVGAFRILSQGSDRYANTVSLGTDGTNSTVSLVASGPAAVTSVQFQYATDGVTFTDVNGILARNADGVFATEWAIPAGVTAGSTVTVKAIRNGGTSVTDTFVVEAAGAGNPAIELATEGELGIYRNPLNNSGNVAVSGTTSANPAPNDIAVFDNDQDYDGAANPGRVNGLTASAVGGVWQFEGVLVYPGNSYPYSPGVEPNQVALTAAIDFAEDTEASTLYLQQVTSVVATPKQNPVPVGGSTNVTVKVTDNKGEPVAGATVGYLSPDGGDAGTDPDDNPNVGTTNAKGEVTITTLGKGTYTAYVDEGTAGYQAVSDLEAAPVTITEFVPVNSSLVASTVDGFSNFDVDEVTGAENGDDLIATLKDQNGNPVANQPVEYSYTFDPTAAGDNTTTAYLSAGNTNADGKVAIPFTNLGVGSYTLNVRRPNVQGTGLLQGTPTTFNVAESEIAWTEGDVAISPVNGTDTYTGRLALTSAGGAALGGRTVVVTWAPGGDAVLSATQPAGTTRDGNTQATAVTAADGTFSVSLTDPPPPPLTDPAAENGVLTADATELSEVPGDPANADARDTLNVKFQTQTTVGRVEVDVDTVNGLGDYAPGKPAAVEVTVYADDDDANPANDPKLEDYPVTVAVDKGFLSPDADANDNGLSADELVLADGQDDEGDLFGFYEQLGASEDLTTGDSGATSGEADIVAAIERDVDFDDDGLAQMEITVTAGGVTETETVTFDSTSYLNLASVALDRAAGEPTGDVTVGDQVDFRLEAKDQFGNLVGKQTADITDDTAVANVVTDGDFGQTQTDFTTDNNGIRATSPSPVVQTLQARLQNVVATTVDNSGDPDAETRTVTETSDPINWVAKPPAEPEPITARLSGKSVGNKDVLTVKAQARARGAKVVLYRQIGNGAVERVGKGSLNNRGQLTLRVKDVNGRGFAKYVAIVKATSKTMADQSNLRRMR